MILAEPFDASQKYCLMHIFRGIDFLDRKAVWLNSGSVKLICGLAFCTQGEVGDKRSAVPVGTASPHFSAGTRALQEREHGLTSQGGQEGSAITPL